MSLTISIFTWLNQICYENGVIESKNFFMAHSYIRQNLCGHHTLNLVSPRPVKFFQNVSMYPHASSLKDNEALCHMEADFFRFQSLTKVKTKNINSI